MSAGWEKLTSWKMTNGFKRLEAEKKRRELSYFTPERLLSHRFRLPETGGEIRKGIRELYTTQHQLYPEFIGVGFIGSQIKGYAKPESDWDLVLLFDEEKTPNGNTEDPITLVNDAFNKFAENNNIVFGKDYSYQGTKSCTYNKSRLGKDLTSLAANIENPKYEQMSDCIINEYQFLFLPYMGEVKEIRRIRKEFFDTLLEKCENNIEKADKVWKAVLEHVFGIENIRTIKSRKKIPEHPRYKLYPQDYQSARKYFVGEK